MSPIRRRLLALFRIAFVLGVFAFAVRALHATLAGYHWSDFFRYLHSMPPARIAAAVVLALTGYLIMTGYDTIAFRYIDHSLPYPWIALASFTGYAINNNLGLSGVVGATLRYRFYKRWGVRAADIARVFVFCTVTYWLGFILLGGLVFLFWPVALPPALHLPFRSVRAFGAVLLVAAFAYVSWILLRRQPLRLRGWSVELPKRPIFVAQLVISMADWLLAGIVLRTVLPPPATVPWLSVLAIFLLAQIAGLVSNVPGGLGVFEVVVLLFLKSWYPPAALLGALVTFRGIYFLMPLAIALVLLCAHEVRARISRAAGNA